MSVVLALLAAGARAELNLTPAESFYEVEGIRVPNVTFRDGAKDIAYTPPAGWSLSGGGKKLTLTPPDAIQAGATIEAVSVKDAPPATAANLQAYSEIALGLVPREAVKAEVIEATVCPMRISGRPLVEVTLSYVFFGQPFRMNLLFLPREKEHLRFQFSSRTADFPPLLKAFRTSLYSMQGL